MGLPYLWDYPIFAAFAIPTRSKRMPKRMRFLNIGLNMGLNLARILDL